MSTGTNGSVILERAKGVMAIFPANHVPAELERKIQGLLRVNGLLPVEEAARSLAERLDRGNPPNDPWRFLVDLVNKDLANASRLAVLVHWIENALRTRVDIALTDEYGSNWHLDLSNFVPEPQLSTSKMGKDYFSQVKLLDAPRLAGRKAPDPLPYPEAALFLADTTLKDLRLILSYCARNLPVGNRVQLREIECTYKGCIPEDSGAGCCSTAHRHSTSRRLRMSSTCSVYTPEPLVGGVLHPNRSDSMLGVVYRARNEIAHSRRLGWNLYSDGFRAARHLLVSLDFDLAKAATRFERKRLVGVHDALLNFGVAEGMNAVLKEMQTPA